MCKIVFFVYCISNFEFGIFRENYQKSNKFNPQAVFAMLGDFILRPLIKFQFGGKCPHILPQLGVECVVLNSVRY